MDLIKSVSKTVSSATKPISKAVSGGLSSTGKMVGSLAKGDIKGAAGGAMDYLQTAKNLAKDSTVQSLGAATGVVGATGSALGSKDLRNAAKNINREGSKGVNKYGDAAMDIGANIATGGQYGAAKTLLGGLSQGGLGYLGSMVNPTKLAEVGVELAGSEYGIDPKMLNMAKAALHGDMTGVAGSYAGLSPNQINMAKSAAKGDAVGVAGNYANLSQDKINMAKSAVKGDAKGTALQGLGSYGGVSKDKLNMIKDVANGKSLDKVAIDQAMKTGRGIASDAVGAYAKDYGLDDMQKQLQNQFKGIDPNKLTGAVVGDNAKRLQDLKSDADFYTSGQVGNERLSSIAGRYWDKAKDGLGAAGSAIAGAAGGAADLIKAHPELTNAVGQGLAAYGGYQAGQGAYDTSLGYAKDNLNQIQQAGSKYQGINYDPNMYQQEEDYNKQVLQGKGYTAQERQMQQQGDIRAGSMASGARQAGLEQQARTGGGAAMGTAGLAASLSGAQGAQNIQSQTNLQREASAVNRMQDLSQRQSQLQSQKFREGTDLARGQGDFGLNQAAYATSARNYMGDLQRGKAGSQAQLYSSLADTAKDYLLPDKNKQNTQQQTSQPQQNVQTQQQQTQQPQQDLSKKTAGAAALVSKQNRTPAATTQTPQNQNGQAIGQFNQTNNKSPNMTPANPNQQYSPMPQNQQSGLTDILNKGAQKGQEWFSKIPQKQQDQIKQQAGNVANNLLKGFKF